MNINTPDAVSISLSVFCIVISLIILFSGLFDQGRGLKLSRIFRFFIFSNIVFMLSDIIMRLLEGGAKWHVFYVLWVCALLHFISGPLILASMTLYMLAYISMRVKVARIVHIVVYSICGLSVLLTIVSQFNNMYYFFDEFNVYHRGPLFLLSQIIPLTGLTANMAIIVYYRQAMQRKVQFFFSGIHGVSDSGYVRPCNNIWCNSNFNWHNPYSLCVLHQRTDGTGFRLGVKNKNFGPAINFAGRVLQNA